MINKRNLRRLFAACLCFCMLFSLLPAAVGAALEGTTEGFSEELIRSMEEFLGSETDAAYCCALLEQYGLVTEDGGIGEVRSVSVGGTELSGEALYALLSSDFDGDDSAVLNGKEITLDDLWNLLVLESRFSEAESSEEDADARAALLARFAESGIRIAEPLDDTMVGDCSGVSHEAAVAFTAERSEDGVTVITAALSGAAEGQEVRFDWTALSGSAVVAGDSGTVTLTANSRGKAKATITVKETLQASDTLFSVGAPLWFLKADGLTNAVFADSERNGVLLTFPGTPTVREGEPFEAKDTLSASGDLSSDPILTQEQALIEDVTAPEGEYTPGQFVPVTVSYSEPVEADTASVTVNGEKLSAADRGLSDKHCFLYPVKTVDSACPVVTELSAVNGLGDVITETQPGAETADGLHLECAKLLTRLPVDALKEFSAEIDCDIPSAPVLTVTAALTDNAVLSAALLSTADGAGVLNELRAAIKDSASVPFKADDSGALTAAIPLTPAPEGRSFTVEVYYGGALLMGSLLRLEQQAVTYVTAADISVSLSVQTADYIPYTFDDPDEPVVYLQDNPKLRADFVIADGTYTYADPEKMTTLDANGAPLDADAHFAWSSTDVSVATIAADGTVTPTGTAGIVSFTLTALNGGEEGKTASATTDPITLDPGEAPFLTISEKTLSVVSGSALPVSWTSNITEKDPSALFDITVTDAGGEVVYAEEKYSGTSFTIPATVFAYSFAAGASNTYEVTVSAKCVYTPYSDKATVTVTPAPARITLNRPDSVFYTDTCGTLTIGWSAESFLYAPGGDASFRLIVTKNGSTVLDSAEPGTGSSGSFTGTASLSVSAITADSGNSASYRDVYTVTAKAANDAEAVPATDSYTFYVFDEDSLNRWKTGDKPNSLVPSESSAIRDSDGTPIGSVLVRSVYTDPETLRCGATVPVIFTVQNDFNVPVTELLIELGGRKFTTESLDLQPGAMSGFQVEYRVPEDTVRDEPWTLTATLGDETFAVTGTAAFGVTDLTLDSAAITVEALGKRTIEYRLSNSTDAKLDESGKTVIVSFYSDSACESPTPGLEPVKITDNASLRLIDEGSFTGTVVYDVGEALKSPEGQLSEIPEEGTPVFLKVTAELDGSVCEDAAPSDNTARVLCENLETRTGKRISVSFDLENTDDSASVTVSVRNNRLAESVTVNVIATLFDAAGNVLDRKQSYDPEAPDKGLLTLEGEETKDLTFTFDMPGDHAEVFYTLTTPDSDTDASLARFDSDDLSDLSLTGFTEDPNLAGTFRAFAAAPGLSAARFSVVPTSPEATVTLDGKTVDGIADVTLSSGSNTLDFTVTAADGETVRHYILTVDTSLNSYSVTEGTAQSYVLGSGKTLVFTCEGPFNRFTGLKINGNAVPETAYTAVAGSTVATLNNAYLESLNAGAYILQFLYTDGTSNAVKFYVKEAEDAPADGTDASLAKLESSDIPNLSVDSFTESETKPGTYTATAAVPGLSRLNFVFAATDPNATIKLNNTAVKNSVNVTLPNGASTLDFQVTSADGSTVRHYVLTLDNSTNVSFLVTAGAGQTFNLTSGKTLEFTCNGAFDLFSSVEVNGVALPTTNYTVRSGSTILTLKNNYLETLKRDTYTIQFFYTNGSSNVVKFYVRNANEPPVGTADASLARVEASNIPVLSISSFTEDPTKPGTFNATVSTASLTSTTITAIPTDANAKVSLNGTRIGQSANVTLKSGVNTLDFTVTSADGTATRHYVLTINNGTGSGYTVTKGAGQTYTLNSGKTLEFTCSGPYDKFSYVKINGVQLAASNYTVKSSPTILTLKNTYLQTLKRDTYTIQFFYRDGSSDVVKFYVRTVNDVPTGDFSSVAPWIAIAVVSCGAICAAVFLGKKKKKEN